MAEKVTIMRLKVDLQCPKCYRKAKKVLCKFPQIQDQVYDEKQNIVTIKVVCCSPEKIRDKICCKGGGSIKSIEIVEPKPPEKPKPPPAEKKEPEKPKPPPPQPEKKEPEKPKPEKPKVEPPKEPEKPKPQPEKPKEKPQPPPAEPPKPPPQPAPAPAPAPVPAPGCPPPAQVPIGICCVPCYEGVPGGPCFQGYGGPPPCYGGYYGRPVYDSYGGGRPCYVSRCDQYLSEENATGCTIM